MCDNSIYFASHTDDEPEMTEIWFTPNDETTIEDIFESMKHCQSLHPDANGKFGSANQIHSKSTTNDFA